MFWAVSVATWVIAVVHGCNWPRGYKCQPLPRVGTFDMTDIEGDLWYEMYTAPKTTKHCVLRVYDDVNNKMYWTDAERVGGPTMDVRNYSFDDDDKRMLCDLKQRYFQQFLGTDDHSWMLLRTCYEGQGEARIILSTKNASSGAGGYVKRGVRFALEHAGLGRMKMFPTDCNTPEFRKGHIDV